MNYLNFYQLKEFPFTITPNLEFYCHLKSTEEAFQIIQMSLEQGEGFVKITGEVGTGKTLLCRKLLAEIKNKMKVAYLPNPALDPPNLFLAVASELEIEIKDDSNFHEIQKQLTHRLIEYHAEDKKVVLLIDEAQALPDESLEAIRLLTNLETSRAKLLQVVLFGQPELDRKLAKEHLRQLKQRITFSYQLKSLNYSDMEAYICHRLSKAGFTTGNLFSKKALKLLHQKSQGFPRLINILAHKALIFGYGKNCKQIDARAVFAVASDTDSVKKNRSLFSFFIISFSLITGFTIVFYALFHYGLHLR